MDANIVKNRKKAFANKVFLVNELVRTLSHETRCELWPRMRESVKGGNYYECTDILAEYGLEPDYLDIWL